MLKRWAALPRGTRWLTGIAAAVLALAFLWALFGPLADWLARQDVGSARGSLHETAVDNARGRLLTLGAGLVALAALVFTARTKLRPGPSSSASDAGVRPSRDLTFAPVDDDHLNTGATQQCECRPKRQVKDRKLSFFII